MHGAGLEVKRSPISGIISIFVASQSVFFCLVARFHMHLTPISRMLELSLFGS